MKILSITFWELWVHAQGRTKIMGMWTAFSLPGSTVLMSTIAWFSQNPIVNAVDHSFQSDMVSGKDGIITRATMAGVIIVLSIISQCL